MCHWSHEDDRAVVEALSAELARSIVTVSDTETLAELCPDCARTVRNDVIAAVGLIVARPSLGGGET